MLKKFDQERLERVNSILEENPLKFPVATISRELNENTSRVSTYLKGTKPMPDKFYVAFMERFGNKSKKEQDNQFDFSSVTPEDLKNLKATILALKHHVALLMSNQSGRQVDSSFKELELTISLYQSNLP